MYPKTPMIKPKEISVVLNIPMKKVYKMIREGSFEVMRLFPRRGSHLRISRSSLIEYLDKSIEENKKEIKRLKKEKLRLLKKAIYIKNQ